MAGWFENNMSALQEYPFDFDRYIEERLREIDELEERRFAKELLLNGLGKVIRCTEQKYRALERRVLGEKEIEANQYEMVMTIVSREHYDPANETLYPVDMDDLDEKKLAGRLSDSRHTFLGTVFLEADEEQQRKFEAESRFSGSLSGEERRFLVQRAGRYRETMEKLYQLFQDNRIPWQTVNTGYLDRFYDIYVEAEITEPSETPDLREAILHFGSFQDKIRTGLLPLWNMKWETFDSVDFALPCAGGFCYEHEFSLEDKVKGDGYLIESTEELLELRREEGKIVMKTQKDTFQGWRALRICQAPTVRSLDYCAPLLTNHRRDSFLRRFAENSGVQLMTKADLFRRIMEMDIQDFIEAAGYELRGDAKEYPAAESMNWFVCQELFPMESRKLLVLQFREKKPGHYLNESMVRFVVSQLQQELSEYRCVGVIV